MKKRTISAILLAFAAVFIVNCESFSDDSNFSVGGTTSSTPPNSSNENDTTTTTDAYAYFLADNTSTFKKLFVKNLKTSDGAVRLSPTTGSDVTRFVVGPSGSCAAYVQRFGSTYELYLAYADGSPVKKLNGALVSGGQVHYNLNNFQFRPNHNQIIYMAKQDSSTIVELYSVNIDNPGVSTKLSGNMVANGNVVGFSISPDGKSLVYQADQNIDGVNELYFVNLDQIATPVKVNPDLGAGRNILRYAFSPDSQRILYNGDQHTDNAFELYMVSTSELGTATKLNSDLPTGSFGILAFFMPSSGNNIVYRGYQNSTSNSELFLVSTDSPGTVSTLNITPAAGGNSVGDVLFSSDNETILYRGDFTSNGVNELYITRLDTPGVSTKINGALVSNGDVAQHYRFNDDATKIVYMADESTDGINEIFVVDLSSPGTSTRLNPTLSSAHKISDILGGLYVKDDVVIYQSDQDTLSRRRLYAVALDSAGITTQVDGFDLTDSRYLVEWAVHW